MDETPQAPPRNPAEVCFDEVMQVLRKHRCRIVPTIQAEQVGSGPLSRMLVATSWGVMPATE